jgi:ribosomal-protein-alanine N-acetyltransferase
MSTVDVGFRSMRTSDLPRVMEIELQCFTMPWSEATFRGLLRRSDADLLVAELGPVVVGYAVLWSVLDQGELGNVSVAPGWRRQGIGDGLVRTVLSRAAERGVREVFLEVRVSNFGAQKLYERYGFTEIARRRNYYLEPVEDALVMRRDLAGAPFLNVGDHD